MSRRIKNILTCGMSFSIVFCLGFSLLEGAQDDDVVRLVVNETKMLPASTPTRIAIGNPVVADVASVSSSEIAVTGKAPGKTTLVYWDNFGEQSATIKVLSEDMPEMKRRVDASISRLGFPELYSKIDEDEAKVVVLGRIKSQAEKERMLSALGSMKDKIIDLTEIKEDESVVEIDVQVLELNKDASSTLGFTWPGSISVIEKGSPGISAAGTKFSTLFKVLNMQRGSVGDGAIPFTAKVDFLVQEGKARVLSHPRLACQSGKEAQLLVGGEKPIMTTNSVSGGGSSSAVEYKEYGIRLKMNPSVLDDNRVKLNLGVEVSEVQQAETLGDPLQPSARAYPLTKRTASTQLYLNDGQTMAIGGLIKQKTEEELRKFPWLADLPVLGMFFRQKQVREGSGFGTLGDTELFITLTPRIVAKDQPKAKDVPESEIKEISRKTMPLTQRAQVPANLVNYIRAVQTKITREMVYPASAREAGWEGEVRLSLRINAMGTLQDMRVTQSSGYQVLDDAAVAVARSQAPYPPFPAQIDSQELWVDVPIVFQSN